MKSKTEMKKLLGKMIERLARIQDDTSLTRCRTAISNFDRWEWPQGVGLYGLFKYYKQTKSPELLKQLEDWYAKRIAAGLPSKNVNTAAPMLTLAHLYEETRNPAHLALCKEWAEWAMRDLARTEDNAFQHITSGPKNTQQIWADTLYMTVLFLGKMGVLLKRQDYTDEAIHQFLVHIKYLFDRGTGLWFHGWTFKGRHNFSRARWGRGNCWFTAGVVDFIEMVNPPKTTRDYLIDTLRAQVDGLTRYQSKKGMWRTLIDDLTSYEETSATAGFGYGILKGVRMGYLDQKYAVLGRRALKAVKTNIRPNGDVANVSIGTPVYDDIDRYKALPCSPTSYGQALAILFLGEALLM